jgi:hypothetical protein
VRGREGDAGRDGVDLGKGLAARLAQTQIR